MTRRRRYAGPVSDRWYPRLHARPHHGWVNDPNGVGYWDGQWHVMCQHNPHAEVWGDIQWAHLSSDDLVTWHEHRAALVPRDGAIDSDGVWSGVAYLEDGDPVLVYTAVPDAGAAAARVAVARPQRTSRGHVSGWTQPDVVVTPPTPPGVRDVRDPFIAVVNGHRFAIQGGGTDDGIPLVLLYDADDLDAWRPLGVLLRGDDPVAAQDAPARLWECPQLVQVDGEWVLIVSLWDDTVPGSEDFGPQRVAWLSGTLDADGAEQSDGLLFTPFAGGPLDAGSACYAPQAARDPRDGRTLLWGWAWEGTRSAPPPDRPDLAARTWAGCLTFPREIEIGTGGVRTPLAREVREAFGKGRTVRARSVSAPEDPWLALVGDADGAEVHVTLDLVGATGPEPEKAERTALWTWAGREIVLTVDGSVLEAYVDGCASTHRLYPRAGETLALRAVDADGSTVSVRMAAWTG